MEETGTAGSIAESDIRLIYPSGQRFGNGLMVRRVGASFTRALVSPADTIVPNISAEYK